MLRCNLELAGFAVTVVAGGAEALCVLDSRSVDAVLLDLVIPPPDGWAVLRRLRRGAGTADLPVVIVSANDDEHDRIRGALEGADGYLTKPFGVGDVVRTIDEVIALPASQRQAAVTATVRDHLRRLAELESGRAPRAGAVRFSKLEAPARLNGGALPGPTSRGPADRPPTG